MNERERLVEFILECDKSNEVLSCFNERPRKRQAAEIIADYLLANGGLCPPCKVGDDLYYPWVYGGTSGIAILEADAIKVYVEGRSLVFIKNPESDMPMPSYFCEEDFGKTVFFSRELAQEALNEQKKL